MIVRYSPILHPPHMKMPDMHSELSIPYGNDNVLPAYLAMPEGEGTHPGLIVIEEIWGVDPHIKSVTDRLGAEGFVALAPELLPESTLRQLSHELNLALFDPKTRNEVQPQLRDAMQPVMQPEFAPQTMAKLKASVDYLLQDERVNGHIGVIGFCFGGTYAFHLAASDDRIMAAVPFYGQPPETSAVASLSCPILNFNGADDERIMAKLPEFEAAMKAAGKEYESVVYPDAGHAFFNDTNPFAYREADAKDAWHKTLAFLHAHLA